MTPEQSNAYRWLVRSLERVSEPVTVTSDRYVAEDTLDLVEVEHEQLQVVMQPAGLADSSSFALHKDFKESVASGRKSHYGDPGRIFEEAYSTAKMLFTIGIELEGHCCSRLRLSDDFCEGVEAFPAKRQAQFKGS